MGLQDWGSGQPVVFSHGWPLLPTTQAATINADLLTWLNT